jgi:hypothetical protein
MNRHDSSLVVNEIAILMQGYELTVVCVCSCCYLPRMCRLFGGLETFDINLNYDHCQPLKFDMESKLREQIFVMRIFPLQAISLWMSCE